MKEIKLTKHCIEEYLNDNPKEKNPEKKLEKLFATMLSKSMKKEAKYRWRDDVCFMEFDNQRIVYKDYKIITYYRIYSPRTINLIYKTKNKVSQILELKPKKKKKTPTEIKNENREIYKKLTGIEKRMKIIEMTNKQRLNDRNQKAKKKTLRIKKLKNQRLK